MVKVNQICAFNRAWTWMSTHSTFHCRPQRPPSFDSWMMVVTDRSGITAQSGVGAETRPRTNVFEGGVGWSQYQMQMAPGGMKAVMQLVFILNTDR